MQWLCHNLKICPKSWNFNKFQLLSGLRDGFQAQNSGDKLALKKCCYHLCRFYSFGPDLYLISRGKGSILPLWKRRSQQYYICKLCYNPTRNRQYLWLLGRNRRRKGKMNAFPLNIDLGRTVGPYDFCLLFFLFWTKTNYADRLIFHSFYKNVNFHQTYCRRRVAQLHTIQFVISVLYFQHMNIWLKCVYWWKSKIENRKSMKIKDILLSLINFTRDLRWTQWRT
jgi:hypothetical protein